MSRRLVGTVIVHLPDGDTVWYGPKDKIPAAHAKLIGDHAWVEVDNNDPDSHVDDDHSGNSGSGDGGSGAPEPPPLSGKGSSIDEWVAYAKALEVDVQPDAKREDIVAAIKAAGHPVEQTSE